MQSGIFWQAYGSSMGGENVCLHIQHINRNASISQGSFVYSSLFNMSFLLLMSWLNCEILSLVDKKYSDGWAGHLASILVGDNLNSDSNLNWEFPNHLLLQIQGI